MSRKYPTLDDRKMKKRLRKKGFSFIKQAKGSHEIWGGRCAEGKWRQTTVPFGREFSSSYITFRILLDDLGLSVEEFYKD